MRRLSLLLLALAATFPDGDETAGEWRNFKYCIANDLPFKAPIYYLDDTPMECTKFSMSSRTPKIFVPQGNKKYAMASTVGANVMPLCFTTQRSGIYTLNFNTKHMDCSYLHLIDNATGADIDLLSTPSYTFDSKDCYYEARFKVVFSEEATNDIMDSFAYLSNGELVITGNGTLQVMDMLGRQLFTREVSSSLLLPASSLAPGVYVVRLINGNDVKAQKIVVG